MPGAVNQQRVASMSSNGADSVGSSSTSGNSLPEPEKQSGGGGGGGERLVFSSIVRPAIENLDRQAGGGRDASLQVLDAVEQLERFRPGFSSELVQTLFRKTLSDGGAASSGESIQPKLHEATLKVAHLASDDESVVMRPEAVFQIFNERSFALKAILAQIPLQIHDRRVFLETIKEIAGAIKRLLDCVHDVYDFVLSDGGRQLIDQRKRDFVKSSKRFSTTLKEFFKDGNADHVFQSANALILQINLIAQVIKRYTE